MSSNCWIYKQVESPWLRCWTDWYSCFNGSDLQFFSWLHLLFTFVYNRFLGTQNPSLLLTLAFHSIALYGLIWSYFDPCLFMSFSIVMVIVLDRASWSSWSVVPFLVQGSGLLFSGKLGPPPPGPWIYLESAVKQWSNICLRISMNYWNHVYNIIMSFSHFIFLTFYHICSHSVTTIRTKNHSF